MVEVDVCAAVFDRVICGGYCLLDMRVDSLARVLIHNDADPRCARVSIRFPQAVL